MPQNNTIVELFTTKLSRSFGSKMFSSSFHNLMRFYRYNSTIWVSNKSRYYNSSIGEVVNSWNKIKGASMNTIGQNLRFSISLTVVGIRISSISKVTISKMMSISITQILGISLSISLSIVGGVRISISISKVAVSKMMSISQILGISLSLSLSIVGGVRISSISSITKVAISKVMSISISQILGI